MIDDLVINNIKDAEARREAKIKAEIAKAMLLEGISKELVAKVYLQKKLIKYKGRN